MNKIIEVKSLSKKYRIGLRQPYYSLRDSIIYRLTNPFLFFKRRKFKEKGLMDDEFWALKDVSFSVEQGEVLGIIGTNGAGKSTLLKILSRITPPTEGEVRLKGRVASLLEVGTGFHPELTGRENIFLNGAILGMTQQEIRKKLDEIVCFAEIDKFMDTPVKRYSSGMYTRLAFSVAAHLDPEILIIDEVLSVGDHEFQKKCLGKMENVAKQGRTILFVSHNLNAVRNICENAILLKDGKLSFFGKVNKTINEYLKVQEYIKDIPLEKRIDRTGLGRVKFTDINLNQAVTGEKMIVDMRYKSKYKIALDKVRIGLGVNDIYGSRLFICSTELFRFEGKILKKEGKISCIIEKLPLTAGGYFIDLFFEVNKEVEDWVQTATKFNVKEGNFFPSSYQCPQGFEGKYVLVPHLFEIQ